MMAGRTLMLSGYITRCARAERAPWWSSQPESSCSLSWPAPELAARPSDQQRILAVSGPAVNLPARAPGCPGRVHVRKVADSRLRALRARLASISGPGWRANGWLQRSARGGRGGSNKSDVHPPGQGGTTGNEDAAGNDIGIPGLIGAGTAISQRCRAPARMERRRSETRRGPGLDPGPPFCPRALPGRFAPGRRGAEAPAAEPPAAPVDTRRTEE